MPDDVSLVGGSALVIVTAAASALTAFLTARSNARERIDVRATATLDKTIQDLREDIANSKAALDVVEKAAAEATSRLSDRIIVLSDRIHAMSSGYELISEIAAFDDLDPQIRLARIKVIARKFVESANSAEVSDNRGTP